MNDAARELASISEEVSACTRCILHHSRKLAVAGEGPAEAELMFIGEGPGFHENEQGRPFVGAAGRFLEELLASIGFTREQVFICNVIKCRPPGNRDPAPEEIEACRPFLERQIKAIDPAVIVTLGRFSMARYFPRARISDIHGQAKAVEGRMIVAMYHPAAALHQPALRSIVEQDFARLPDYIQKAKKIPRGDEPEPSSPEQLELF